MKKMFLKTLLIVSMFLVWGCAATYKPINPPSINYSAHNSQDNVNLAYKYNVLSEKGNRKYEKKEEKKRIKLIAIKLTNNTDKSINIGKDVAFYSGNNEIFPMDPMAIKNSIKQVVPGYLPHLLFTFMTLNVTNGTSTEVYPIGLLLGPAITIGNMSMAASANDKLLKELTEYNLLNKDVAKGETIYGIIGVRDTGYYPISVKFKTE